MLGSRWYNKQVRGRAVWCPVGKSRAVALHIALAKLKLSYLYIL
jgi:hypothetical protein